MNDFDQKNTAIATISGELSGLRNQKNQLSQRLIAIRNQITLFRDLPVNQEDFRAYFDQLVERSGQEYVATLRFGDWFKSGNFATPVDERPWSYFEGEDESIKSTLNWPDGDPFYTFKFGAICYFMPGVAKEKLWEAFCQQTSHRWKGKAQPSVKQRREQITQLEQEEETIELELQKVNQAIAHIQEALNL